MVERGDLPKMVRLACVADDGMARGADTVASGGAIALFAAWLAGCEALRRALASGALLARANEPASGAPRWRAALGFYLQCSLGGLFVLFHAAGRARSSALVGQLFILIFGGFLLYDFVVLDIRPALAVHHVVCLLGHAYVVVFVGSRDAAFYWYFAGVVALEAGSAACNAWCLWPSHSLPIYVVGMTASNAASIACVRRWALGTAASRRARVISVTVTVLLICVRQWLAMIAQ